VPYGTGRSPVPDGTGRSFDAVIEYGAVAMMATEKRRTAKPAARPKAMGRRAAVRATCLHDRARWRSPHPVLGFRNTVSLQ
jgi:hypothetical protein